MNKKQITILVVAIVFFVLAVTFGYFWYQNKMIKVEAGSARSNFPYKDYTIEELEKMYPQYIENTATTTQTPEETHKKFVEALKKGDLKEAVECCIVKENIEKINIDLAKIKTDGYLDDMIKDLDSPINKKSMDQNRAVFSYSIVENNKKYGQLISFLKDINGVWLIESL